MWCRGQLLSLRKKKLTKHTFFSRAISETWRNHWERLQIKNGIKSVPGFKWVLVRIIREFKVIWNHSCMVLFIPILQLLPTLWFGFNLSPLFTTSSKAKKLMLLTGFFSSFQTNTGQLRQIRAISKNLFLSFTITLSFWKIVPN